PAATASPRRIAEAASGANRIDYRSIVAQFPHDLVQPRLALEADAGAVGERDKAALDAGVVGEAAEIAEHAGIGFRPAQPETGGNRQRHLVAAVRKHPSARPAVRGQHLERAAILHDAEACSGSIWITSLRSGLRPPKRTRFSTSCVENRFSPVES